jgi:hypothetical protein
VVDYFGTRARRVRGRQGLEAPKWARTILRWIRNHPTARHVTASDVTRPYSTRLGSDPDAIRLGFD